jgi:hypothetical protein
MSLHEHGQKDIDSFFAEISAFENVYNKNSAISYCALRQDNNFILLRARLFLNTAPSDIPSGQFKSENIIVGHYSLNELGLNAHQLLEQLLSGVFVTPKDEIQVPPEADGFYSTSYIPFHNEGLQLGNRVDILRVTGKRQLQLLRQPFCDWEVKAASTPYDSLNELLTEYRLISQMFDDCVSFELVAFNVAVVNSTSTVNGSKANIFVTLADGLLPDKLTLGYRIFSQSRVISRAIITGNGMHWVKQEPFQIGKAELEIPKGAVLHLIASYDGKAQNQGWLSDPSTAQNPQRAVFMSFDHNLEALKDFLATSSHGKGHTARNLETGVAWLLWMLGFKTAHLGDHDKTQNAPDLVATTPNGNFVIVECTTALLKTDKLALLVERANAVRKNLELSGNSRLRVLPVFVTSKSNDDVKSIMEYAERIGVYVMTRESLERAIERTLVLPDTEAMYKDAENSVLAAQAKYQSTIPGVM